MIIDGALPYYSMSSQIMWASDAPQYRLAAPAYAKSADPSQQWVPLLEKGVAATPAAGVVGYAQMNLGDFGARTLAFFSGRPSQAVMLKDAPREGTWIAMNEAVAAHRAMVAGTRATLSLFDVVINRLVDHHAYTVLGTKTIDGQHYVVLRNPMGYRSRLLGVAVGDPVFKLRFDRFMSSFQRLAIK